MQQIVTAAQLPHYRNVLRRLVRPIWCQQSQNAARHRRRSICLVAAAAAGGPPGTAGRCYSLQVQSFS